MTKWKVVRIKESLYQKIIKDAKYGETFSDVLEKILGDVTW